MGEAARRIEPASPVRRFLHDALAQPAPAGATLVVHLPAPLGAPDAIADSAPDVLFQPPAPEALALAGTGVAARVAVDGPARFSALRTTAADLFARLVVRSHQEATFARVRLLGGLAFAPGFTEPAWRAFGDGVFTLPRWTYAREGAIASLSFAGPPPSTAAARDAIAAEYDQIVARLAAPRASATNDARASITRVTELPRESWAALVEAARGAIAAGAFDKLVCARRTTVEAEAPFDAARTLAALQGAPGCTRFALRAGDAFFLGATPERLVGKRGARVRTEALAGSISAAAAPDAAGLALLASDKDRAEHGFVVEEIVRRLRPRCRALAVPDRPSIRALRHVLHLHTPIEGELDAPAHILDLVEALHPTPAVGGLPGRAAIDWIAAHEPAPRGLYAGPIGWFDEAGDGEFMVALRCGLLDGARALVYAGAGIVAASDPAAEYAETALKQQALLAALDAAA